MVGLNKGDSWPAPPVETNPESVINRLQQINDTVRRCEAFIDQLHSKMDDLNNKLIPHNDAKAPGATVSGLLMEISACSQRVSNELEKLVSFIGG